MSSFTKARRKRQLSGALAGFIIIVFTVDAGGLASWAQRLDVGPVRNVALQITSRLPLPLVQMRQKALNTVQKIGWSADAAGESADELTQQVSEAASTRITVANDRNRPESAVSAQDSERGAPLPPKDSITLVQAVPKITSLRPLEPLAVPRTRVVALVGDSMMAVGLSSALLSETSGRQGLRYVKAFRSGTGLSRPDVFDWMHEYPARIGREKPDVVVVAIGANDAQSFVDHGEALRFGTTKWTRVYEQRVESFLALLSRDDARVVWIGLPPMRVAGFNSKIAELNRITYSIILKQGKANWWNPAPYLGDEGGRFREFASLGTGKTDRIRAIDGIHLSDQGARLLTPTLIHWLTEGSSKRSNMPVAIQ